MQSEGSYPHAVTLVSVLKACGSIGAIEKGRMIHDKVQRMGLISENIELGTALVDMYAKCGMLVKASQVLEELTHRDVVSWNALIAGYTQCGQAREALHCFEKMQDDGVIPDAVTFTCILKACRSIGAVIAGEEIYEEIISRGLLESNVVLSTALVDLFARCGLLARAQNLHDNVCTQSVASWNALISGYAHEGQHVEVMNCFQVMERQGFIPDSVTFICILQTCGNTGAIEKAGEIHEKILSRDLLGKNLVLAAALVEMYVKCGNLSKASSLVEGFPFQNIALWNSLMAGYSQKGESSKTLSLFKQIQSEGVVIPDAITFLSVLCACCRLGLWEEAEVHFGQMTRECGIVPELEHYSCMVAVYGSAGRLDKARSVIEGMPCPEYPTIWVALLAACRTWGNVSLGRIAFHEVIRLDSSCAAAYALMANVFTTNGMPDDALEVECMQAKLGNFDGNLDNLSLLF
jgi:pentatricopeptide repeat protein